MILRNLKNSPEKIIPVAMAFIATGMSILVVGITWPKFAPSLPHAGTDWNDFARGVTYGISIALEVCGVVLAASAVAAKRKQL